MSQRVVYLNGDYVAESEAKVSIYDASLCDGGMAFEVCRTFGGHLFKLREHLERLHDTLTTLRIDARLALQELESLAQETLSRNIPTEASDVDWNLIVNISSGPSSAFQDAFSAEELRPTVIISCFPLTRRLASMADTYRVGVDAVLPAQTALPPELLNPSIKTRGRIHFFMAAKQASAMQPGAVAILVNQEGHLTESTSANVFLVRDGQLFTPRQKDVLRGVTRGVIMELAAGLGLNPTETDLSVEDAEQANELLLTSTSVGVLHARSFNGTPVGDGKFGPVGNRLRAAFDRLVGVDLAAQAASCAERISG